MLTLRRGCDRPSEPPRSLYVHRCLPCEGDGARRGLPVLDAGGNGPAEGARGVISAREGRVSVLEEMCITCSVAVPVSQG